MKGRFQNGIWGIADLLVNYMRSEHAISRVAPAFLRSASIRERYRGALGVGFNRGFSATDQ